MGKERWDSTLYDEKIGYVSRMGKGLIDLLDPKEGEAILDLGCGTGDLAGEIAARGARVKGIDASQDMVEKARKKYPELEFERADARHFIDNRRFDAVFSNAALHWIKPPEQVAQTVWTVLKPGGRFVAEFGGKGNVETIVRAIEDVLRDWGIDAKARNPWYFPSIGEYGTLLENQGFVVTYAEHFARPTPFDDGEKGLSHWLDMFADVFFQGMTASDKAQAHEQIENRLRDSLFHEGVWTGDYKRIRVRAIKPL